MGWLGDELMRCESDKFQNQGVGNQKLWEGSCERGGQWAVLKHDGLTDNTHFFIPVLAADAFLGQFGAEQL